jgi:hypothetical protein
MSSLALLVVKIQCHLVVFACFIMLFFTNDIWVFTSEIVIIIVELKMTHILWFLLPSDFPDSNHKPIQHK